MAGTLGPTAWGAQLCQRSAVSDPDVSGQRLRLKFQLIITDATLSSLLVLRKFLVTLSFDLEVWTWGISVKTAAESTVVNCGATRPGNRCQVILLATLGTKGIATRSKDATSSSWSYY